MCGIPISLQTKGVNPYNNSFELLDKGPEAT